MSPHRSFSARSDVEALLEARGAARLDVPVLQPADAFLDTAGEELRRRIFLTGSESGEMLCLRPEFTIPVCLHHLRENGGPKRYGYVGTVFRQRRQGSAEFLQAGIEDIGNTNRAKADARSMADALALLGDLGVRRQAIVMLGDQAVFDAVLAALSLPKGWRLRLAHAFGNADALKAVLASFAAPVTHDVPDAVMQAAHQGPVALEDMVRQRMGDAGLLNAGGRTPAEIAARLMAKIDIAENRPDAKALDTLKAFLDLRLPLDEADGALSAFAHRHGLNLDVALDGFDRRNEALAAEGINLAGVHYDASFGRTLDYYTGLVYEMRGPDGAVLAGGGRYDRLLTMLGAEEPVPGIGFSIWLDRVAALNAKGGAA